MEKETAQRETRREKTLRTILLGGLVAALAMPFVYVPSTTFPFVFAKAVSFSVLVEVLFVLYALYAAWVPAARPRRSVLFLSLLAYMAALCMTALTGVDPHRSFWGNHERMSGVSTLLHFFFYFVIARSVIRDMRHWRWVFSAFLVSSVVMSSIALIEHFSAHGILASTPGGRVWATLGNYIYLGVYMLFALFIAAYLFTTTRVVWQRIVLVLIGFLDGYVLVLTESRASLFVVLATIALVGFLSMHQARNPRIRRAAWVSVAVVLGLGLAVYLAKQTAFVQAIPGVRRIVNTPLTISGNRTRFLAWQIAVEAWKQKPFLGWGPENFYAAFNLHYHPESLYYSYYETWFDRAHNVFFDSLVMHGIVGTLVYLGIFAAIGATVVRRVRRGRLTTIQGALFLMLFGAYFLQNLTAFDALSGFLLFYLVCAFLDSDAATAEEAGAVRPSGTTRLLLVVSLAALIALPLLVVHMNMWRANAEGLRSIAYLRAGRLEEALALHKKALERNSPHAPEIRTDFGREAGPLFTSVPPGQEKIASTMLQTVIEDLRENIRSGKDVYDAILLSQILATIGQQEPRALAEAERVIREAVALSPKRQQVHFTLARILLLQGRAAEAVTLMARVTLDEPRVGESHWILAVAYAEAGKQAEAWEEIKKALANAYPWHNALELGLASQLATDFGTPSERVAIAALWVNAGGGASALATLADAEAALGATSSAQEHMQQALEQDASLASRADALWQKIGRPAR